jgi:putative colanic acid biosynthesis glycosyltransferase
MTDHTPLFTVVTVTWNNLDGLQATARSLVGQSDTGYEWRVVDGGSQDGTQDWLARQEIPALHWFSEPDEGIYDAMNKGTDAATGTYLIYMNAGDLFAGPEVLARARATLEVRSSPPPDVLYGTSYEEADGALLLKSAFPPERIWYSMFTHHQAIFYRRAALGALRYDASFRIAGDWALTARLWVQGARFEALGLVVCIFERGGLSQSGRPDVVRRMHEERRRVHREVFGLSPLRSRAILLLKGGVEQMRYRFPGLYDLLRFRKRSDQ